MIKQLTAEQALMLQRFTQPFIADNECVAEAAIRRVEELTAENERLKAMFRYDSSSWFWQNCRKNRRQGNVKCCKECPFIEMIEEVNNA